MSDPDFDHSDGGWDDFSREPGWSESQWRGYLKGADREMARFLDLYNKLKEAPNHLDEIAVRMGWDAEDMSMAEQEVETSGGGADDFADEEIDEGPYTLHRHPVFVVTRGLYRYLHGSWEQFMLHSQTRIAPRLCWQYANSLHHGETNVILALQALDLGDYGLAICHLKNSLSALNQTLALVDQLAHPNPRYLENFRHEVRIRIFDLRELWLRVMGDCRAECGRRSDEQE